MSRVNTMRNIVTGSIFKAHIHSSAGSDTIAVGSGLIGQRKCVSTCVRTTGVVVSQTGSKTECVSMLEKYRLNLSHGYSVRSYNISKGTLCKPTNTLLVSVKSPLKLKSNAFHSRCHPSISLAKTSDDKVSQIESALPKDTTEDTIEDGTMPDKHVTQDGEESEKHPIGQVKSTRMRIVYTCKVCGAQNTNTFAKSSYTHGVVIVTCEGCKNNHLIADNLGWFQDVGKRNIEEILASKGETVRKMLTNDGTLEVHDGGEDA